MPKPLRLARLHTNHQPSIRAWSASEMQEAASSEQKVLGEDGTEDVPTRNGSAGTEELEKMFPKPDFALQDDTLDIKESIIMQVCI